MSRFVGTQTRVKEDDCGIFLFWWGSLVKIIDTDNPYEDYSREKEEEEEESYPHVSPPEEDLLDQSSCLVCSI